MPFGLQVVAWTLEAHAAASHSMQFRIDQWGELLHAREFPLAPDLERLGGLCGFWCSHRLTPAVKSLVRSGQIIHLLPILNALKIERELSKMTTRNHTQH